jgi:hypothetical protein
VHGACSSPQASCCWCALQTIIFLNAPLLLFTWLYSTCLPLSLPCSLVGMLTWPRCSTWCSAPCWTSHKQCSTSAWRKLQPQQHAQPPPAPPTLPPTQPQQRLQHLPQRLQQQSKRATRLLQLQQHGQQQLEEQLQPQHPMPLLRQPSSPHQLQQLAGSQPPPPAPWGLLVPLRLLAPMPLQLPVVLGLQQGLGLGDWAWGVGAWASPCCLPRGRALLLLLGQVVRHQQLGKVAAGVVQVQLRREREAGTLSHARLPLLWEGEQAGRQACVLASKMCSEHPRCVLSIQDARTCFARAVWQPPL